MSADDWIDPSRVYDPSLPAGRLMYLWAGFVYPLLAFSLIGLTIGMIELLLGYSEDPPIVDLITSLMVLGSFLAGIVGALRRLKDLGKSGWTVLLALIPLVNLIFVVWLLLAPGNEQSTHDDLDKEPKISSTDSDAESERMASRKRRYCIDCGTMLPTAASYCPSRGKLV